MESVAADAICDSALARKSKEEASCDVAMILLMRVVSVSVGSGVLATAIMRRVSTSAAARIVISLMLLTTVKRGHRDFACGAMLRFGYHHADNERCDYQHHVCEDAGA